MNEPTSIHHPPIRDDLAGIVKRRAPELAQLLEAALEEAYAIAPERPKAWRTNDAMAVMVELVASAAMTLTRALAERSNISIPYAHRIAIQEVGIRWESIADGETVTRALSFGATRDFTKGIVRS